MKIITIIFILTLSCSSAEIGRDIEPVDRYNTQVLDDKCAISKSRGFDITIEPINDNQWKSLLENDVFLNKERSIFKKRIPPLIFFQIIIENTDKLPVTLGNITLAYNDIKINPVTIQAAAENFKSSSNIINFENIFKSRKLKNIIMISEDDPEISFSSGLIDTENKLILIEEIDYDKQTEIYGSDTVKTGDRIIFIKAFDFIPVENRIFYVILTLKTPDEEKVIDFKFKRFEYRINGKYFVKPEPDDYEF